MRSPAWSTGVFMQNRPPQASAGAAISGTERAAATRAGNKGFTRGLLREPRMATKGRLVYTASIYQEIVFIICVPGSRARADACSRALDPGLALVDHAPRGIEGDHGPVGQLAPIFDFQQERDAQLQADDRRVRREAAHRHDDARGL